MYKMLLEVVFEAAAGKVHLDKIGHATNLNSTVEVNAYLLKKKFLW